jgi:RNase H-fold protein (predicted Holliday junction resolvase)
MLSVMEDGRQLIVCKPASRCSSQESEQARDLGEEQILERLVLLNAERAAEERRGLIHWLRPAFQNPQGQKSAKAATHEKLATASEPDDSAVAAPVAATAAAWPKKLAEQIADVRDLLTKGAAEWTVVEAAAAFKGAKRADVEEVLDSLAALGILAAYESRGTRRWKSTRA